MKALTLTAFVFAVSYLSTTAQEANNNVPSKNTGVTIISNSKVDSLVEKHIRINAESKGFPGFRVQIFSDSGNEARKRQNDKRSAFLAKNPDVPAYSLFESPNFIVRVGDFRTKLEARKFLNQIAVDFPYAFVRKDLIQFPELE